MGTRLGSALKPPSLTKVKTFLTNSSLGTPQIDITEQKQSKRKKKNRKQIIQRFESPTAPPYLQPIGLGLLKGSFPREKRRAWSRLGLCFIIGLKKTEEKKIVFFLFWVWGRVKEMWFFSSLYLTSNETTVKGFWNPLTRAIIFVLFTILPFSSQSHTFLVGLSVRLHIQKLSFYPDQSSLYI